MTLRIRPHHVKLAQYSIYASGLEGFPGCVPLSSTLYLMQGHPDPYLHLCPIRKRRHPTESEAWFYANCVAYEHEVPTVVIPSSRDVASFRYRYVHSGPSYPTEVDYIHLDGSSWRVEKLVRSPRDPRLVTRTFLIDQLLVIFDMIRELRHGPLTYVLFRGAEALEKCLPYTEHYRDVQAELALYATALRQADFLAEYLGYCRVIERVVRSTSGKKWKTAVTRALAQLKQHEFGSITIVHPGDKAGRHKDLLKVYKRWALQALNRLRQQHGDDRAIAEFMFHRLRCGVAHGVQQPLQSEMTAHYFDIVCHAHLMKMVARLAIDEKREGKGKTWARFPTTPKLVEPLAQDVSGKD